ncbi:MAG: SDR family oxidoreductase [Candidatus Dormibacteraeota bacterium]|uniref:Alcohol dehydrogenase n=1 Tax=Candidatus Aeolococcus gillhamiae TaxID=3127015 RepID=A0A2W6A4K6_9BACT|nr:SDR family oxidoreductase [Candidatus Dormibacteraeota bacterium]PZR78524.1 MAG: alcohol dehydrogenase [Candidatus Dormibacter sp. RRmetagenome_bin12]
MTAELRGRRVLVTGAGGALGGATTRALRAAGAIVAGLDLIGGGVIACDIRDADSVSAAVARARTEMGGIDAVVHFAGVGMPTSSGAAPGDAVSRTVDINLLGPWRVTAACIDQLVAQRGRLVFVASQLAYATIPFAAAYTVSKRGLAAYADSVRAEYGSHVGVTTVYPGYIRTPIHDASIAEGLSLDGATRPQRPADVVATVLRALTADRPPRDLACSALGRFELAACRHLPRTADAVIRRRLRRDLARGRHNAAPLAAAMRSRLGFPDPTPTARPTEERIA